MDTLLTCANCGHTGHDVRMKLVKLPEPWRMVRGVNGEPVPERFAWEPRCVPACRQEAVA